MGEWGVPDDLFACDRRLDFDDIFDDIFIYHSLLMTQICDAFA